MRIEIVVDDGVRPLSGRIWRDADEPVAFCGWLPLLGILERLTSSVEPSAERFGGQLGARGDPDLAEDVG